MGRGKALRHENAFARVGEFEIEQNGHRLDGRLLERRQFQRPLDHRIQLRTMHGLFNFRHAVVYELHVRHCGDCTLLKDMEQSDLQIKRDIWIIWPD